LITPIQRLLTNIIISDGGCWEWQLSLRGYGYGRIKVGRKTFSTHRFMYVYYYNTIDPSLQIHHKCNNAKCCNPHHLVQITARENTLQNNNPTAKNFRKTHCKYGHEFTTQNTHYRKSGGRRCLTCKRVAAKKLYYKQKEKKNNG